MVDIFKIFVSHFLKKRHYLYTNRISDRVLSYFFMSWTFNNFSFIFFSFFSKLFLLLLDNFFFLLLLMGTSEKSMIDSQIRHNKYIPFFHAKSKILIRTLEFCWKRPRRKYYHSVYALPLSTLSNAINQKNLSQVWA